MKRKSIMTMIGFVQNVAMITFHGEKNVTNVMLPKMVEDLKDQEEEEIVEDLKDQGANLKKENGANLKDQEEEEIVEDLKDQEEEEIVEDLKDQGEKEIVEDLKDQGANLKKENGANLKDQEIKLKKEIEALKDFVGNQDHILKIEN